MKYAKPVLTLFLIVLIAGCAAQNAYQTNLTVEAEVAALAEQYTAWRQMMEPEVQEDWDKIFVPAFSQLDSLMDSYHNLLANNMETITIVNEINRLKTQIMIALTKKMAESDKEVK